MSLLALAHRTLVTPKRLRVLRFETA